MIRVHIMLYVTKIVFFGTLRRQQIWHGEYWVQNQKIASF